MVNLSQISRLFRHGRIVSFVRPCRPKKMSVHVRVGLRLIHVSLFGGFLLLCLVWGCSDKIQTGAEEKIAIRVDNRVLTLDEFNEYFGAVNVDADTEGDQEDTAIREARLRYLLQLVEEMIILRRADELNLQISPKELDEAVHNIKKDYPEKAFEDLFFKQAISFDVWKERLKRRLLVEKVILKDVLKDDFVTPEQIQDYYEQHRTEWIRGEEIRARHILLSKEAEAKNILELLQAGHDFADLARLHSRAPEALQGGDMGYVVRGQLPGALEEPLFELEPGDVSSVIRTHYGFHIFHVIEKREKHVPDIEESTERIRQGLQKERLEVAYGPWLAELRSRYQIEINQEII